MLKVNRTGHGFVPVNRGSLSHYGRVSSYLVQTMIWMKIMVVKGDLRKHLSAITL